MKLKLDENIGRRGFRLLTLAEHDVATVSEQSLCSASDRELIAVCRFSCQAHEDQTFFEKIL